MKYILFLLTLIFSVNTFAFKATDKVCHSKDNQIPKPEQLCNDSDKKCGSGMNCKEMGEKPQYVGAVPGTGEKADTACKDVVQTQAEKDAAAKAKQGKADAGAVK